MSTNLSPSMSLPIPVVGSEAGPQYATDINNCMTIIDQHTHAAGSGVPITPTAININSALTFNSNFATGLAGLTLVQQNSTPANSTVYRSGVDLYYTDGLGNNIQITAAGGVAGTPGSISNLVSPASASYVGASKTFVWQSDTSIAANMDFGSAIFRNVTPNSTFGITVQAPAALSSNYNITLPALPGSQKIMTLDNTGLLAAPYTVDGSTVAISANVIGVPAGGITITQMAANSVGTTQLVDASVTPAKKSALGEQVSSGCGSYNVPGSFTQVTNLSVTITTTGRPVHVGLEPDGTSNARIAITSGDLLIRILRDGTPIKGFEISALNSAFNACPGSAVNATDRSASAASHTYTVQAQYNTLSSGNAAVENCVLVAYEL